MDTSTITPRNTTARKARKNVTIESIIIKPLPSEFIDYLSSDGVRLPDCARKVSSCMNDNDNDDQWDSSSDEEDEVNRYIFPAFTEKIRSALETLGDGERNLGCMPKMNWSSPKDACWINQGSLKCTKVGDVYLLLKSSEFVTFDLEKAFEDLEDEGATKPTDFEYELVLRKWCNLHPSMEFRCFVHDHRLLAISQRHPSKFYAHLQPLEDGSPHPSLDIIFAFYETYVQGRFASGNVHRYVLDLYLDSQERVWIVDVNVWGSRTDGLLFTWGELTEIAASSMHDDDPEMRVVTKDMKSMTYDPLSSFRGPTDIMNLLGGSHPGGSGSDTNLGDLPSFQDFMSRCVRPSEM